MFKRERPIVLKGSVSALSNNLSVQVNAQKKQIMYAVAHKSVVNLVNAAADGSNVTHRQIVCKEPSGGPAMIIQCKLCLTPSRTILVITSPKGILMYEAETAAMLYWYAITDNMEGVSMFGRGICGVLNDLVCVGNHEGGILVFHVPLKGTNITLQETLKGHHAPVHAMDADKSYVVSSDDVGDIIVWKAGSPFQQIRRIKGKASPCTSLRLWNDLLVAGYGTGHIRIFFTNTGKIVAEIAAHGKAINSVDVAQTSGLMLSVGEDAFARVWQLKAGGEPQVSHVSNEPVKDVQLQGCAFLHPEGVAFGVVGYDLNEIVFFTKAK